MYSTLVFSPFSLHLLLTLCLCQTSYVKKYVKGTKKPCEKHSNLSTHMLYIQKERRPNIFNFFFSTNFCLQYSEDPVILEKKKFDAFFPKLSSSGNTILID